MEGLGIRLNDMATETEVWFRNPHNYIRELVECGEYRIAWDRGLLVKKRIDPAKHAELYYGQTYPYRILLVGEQGTAELRPGDTIEKPSAVYPTWIYGDDAAILEELVTRPVGQDMTVCNDMSVPPDERPVYGQEHRIVIAEMPKAVSGAGRQFLRFLKELQEDYPDVIFHVHGLYGWRVAFGMGFAAADVEPRTTAQKGRVILPSGKEEQFEHVQKNVKWVTNLGFKPVDLAEPRKRCMFNIKSAVWAGKHYNEIFNFRVNNRNFTPDVTSSDDDHTPAEAGLPITASVKKKEGDQFICDTCSLQDNCKYYRQGSVCTVPGAEPTPLSRFFGSRDASTIIDGLSLVLQANANRLEKGMRYEDIDGEISKEVSSLISNVFDQGTKLAKLVDPTLNGGPKVNINVGAGGTAVATANPKALVASAIRELEARGVPRDKITPEMIQGLFAGMNDEGNRERAIQSTAIESRILDAEE